MATINWGILGTDFISEDFAKNLCKNKGVYAIASTNKDKIRRLQETACAKKVYEDYHSMYTDENVEIVYVSTLGNEHYENIKQCLNNNKHVFVEKSILNDSKKMRELYKLSKEKKLFLGEAMTIFYMPLYKLIEDMIENGCIGKLKMIRADFGSLKDESPTIPIFMRDKLGGSMLDIGTYALTASLLFNNKQIDSKSVVMNKHIFGVDESWSISFKSDEVLTSINLFITSKLPKRLVIAGDKAYIEIYNYPRADYAEIVYPDFTRKIISEGNTENAVQYEISAVEDMLSQKDFSDSKMDISVKVVEIMDNLLTKYGGE